MKATSRPEATKAQVEELFNFAEPFAANQNHQPISDQAPRLRKQQAHRLCNSQPTINLVTQSLPASGRGASLRFAKRSRAWPW